MASGETKNLSLKKINFEDGLHDQDHPNQFIDYIHDEIDGVYSPGMVQKVAMKQMHALSGVSCPNLRFLGNKFTFNGKLIKNSDELKQLISSSSDVLGTLTNKSVLINPGKAFPKPINMIAAKMSPVKSKQKDLKSTNDREIGEKGQLISFHDEDNPTVMSEEENPGESLDKNDTKKSLQSFFKEGKTHLSSGQLDSQRIKNNEST